MQDFMAQQQQLHPQPMEDGLRAVRDLPACFHPIFGSFRYFNIVQSECFSVAYGTDHNMVVSAPTGSGKTGVLELAMLRCLSRHITPGSSNSSFQAPRGTSKIIYVGPIRALVQERVQDWGDRFGRLGCTCVELTGDNDAMADNLAEADIICTTPEKFDMKHGLPCTWMLHCTDQVTRRMQEYGAVNFLSQTSLVMLDEVHLLNEAGRGSSLEAGTVCRIKMVSQIPELDKMPIASVRFVAVSATIPNFQDIAAWLRVPPCGALQFGEELRPVKLTTYVKGYAPAKNDFLFERRLNNFLHDVVLEHHHGRPALVFCNSRKGAADAAAAVAKDAATRNRGPFGSTFVSSALQLQHLQGAAAQTKNKALQGVLVAGVGFHNAAMEPEDRALVEGLFKTGDLQVLCTTSTLAMGVNLPAHLVVIKGTRRYVGEQELAPGDRAGYREYARSECLQMVGRAGRPQFDTEGVAVIMTQQSTVGQYQVLVDGQLVESCLPGSVAEHLNAELVLGTVKDMASAVSWLHTTFLYQRAMRSPAHYGFCASSLEELQQQVTQKYVLSNISTLTTYGMVETSASSNDPTHAQQQQAQLLKPLQPGRIMAQNFLRLGTMVEIAKEQPRPGMSALLAIVCKAEEFKNITLRRSEKKVLNEINHSSGVRFHVTEAAGAEGAKRVKQRIQTAQEKLLILINEGLSDSPSDQLDYGMKQEMDTVLRAGQRITTAMYKYYSHKNQLSAAGNALLLARSFRQRLWDNSQQQVRQLKNVTKPIAEKLAAAGLGGLRDVLEMDPHNCNRLQAAAGKYYPFGLNLIMDLRRLAPPPMSLDLSLQRRVGPHALDCQLVVAPAPGAGPEGAGMAADSSFTLVCGCVNTDTLLLWRHVVPAQLHQQLELPFKVVLPPGTQGPVKLTAFLIHNKMVGFDQSTQLHVELDGRSTALAAGSAAHHHHQQTQQQKQGAVPQQQGRGYAGVPAAAAVPAAEVVSPSTHSSSTSASCHRPADLEGQEGACADSAAATGGTAGASSKRAQGSVAAAGAGGSKRPRRLQAPPPDDPFACQDTAMLLSPVQSAATGPAAAGGAAASWSTPMQLGGFAMQPPSTAAAAAGHQSSAWGATAPPAGATSSIAARYASFLQQKQGLRQQQQDTSTAPTAISSPSPTAGSSAQPIAAQLQQQQPGKDTSSHAPRQQEAGWQEQERVAAADDAALLYVSPMPSITPPGVAAEPPAMATAAVPPRKPFEAFGRGSLSSSGQLRSAAAAGLQLPVLKRFKPAAGGAQPAAEPAAAAAASSCEQGAAAADGISKEALISSHQSVLTLQQHQHQQHRGQASHAAGLGSSTRLCRGNPSPGAAGGGAARPQNWELFDDLAADAGQQQQQASTSNLLAGGLQHSSHPQTAAAGQTGLEASLTAVGAVPQAGMGALQRPVFFWGSGPSSHTQAPAVKPPPPPVTAAGGLGASAAVSRWSTQHTHSSSIAQRPMGLLRSPAVTTSSAGPGSFGSWGHSRDQGDAMDQLLQQPSSSFSYAAASPAPATATGFKQAVEAAAAAAGGGGGGVRSGAAQLLAKLGRGNSSSRLPLGAPATAALGAGQGTSSTPAANLSSRGLPGGLGQFAFQPGAGASGMVPTAVATTQQQQPPAAGPGGLRLGLGVPQLRPGLFGGAGSSSDTGRSGGVLRPLGRAPAAAASTGAPAAAAQQHQQAADGEGGAGQGWAGFVGDATADVAVGVRSQGSKPACAAGTRSAAAGGVMHSGSTSAVAVAPSPAATAAGAGVGALVGAGYQDLASVFDFL